MVGCCCLRCSTRVHTMPILESVSLQSDYGSVAPTPTARQPRRSGPRLSISVFLCSVSIWILNWGGTLRATWVWCLEDWRGGNKCFHFVDSTVKRKITQVRTNWNICNGYFLHRKIKTATKISTFFPGFFFCITSYECIRDFHINGFLLSPDIYLFILQPRDEASLIYL